MLPEVALSRENVVCTSNTPREEPALHQRNGLKSAECCLIAGVDERSAFVVRSFFPGMHFNGKVRNEALELAVPRCPYPVSAKRWESPHKGIELP